MPRSKHERTSTDVDADLRQLQAEREALSRREAELRKEKSARVQAELEARHVRVGEFVDAAGLFGEDDDLLQRVFQCLGHMASVQGELAAYAAILEQQQAPYRTV